jgi:sugar-specific transcriptional regulator TrmB
MTRPSISDEPDIREELAVFGFSDTEIDAYLAILAQGETTTRDVSEEADVTQRAVYNIAERLANRGLVRVKEHASPTMIKAVPPGEAIANLSERLESIQPSLEETYTQTATESPEIQIVRSRETAIKRLRESIEGADQEIAIAIPEDVYPEIEADLRAAKERGMFVLLLLVECDDPDAVDRDYGPVADVVRYWDQNLQFLYVTDDDDAMIGEDTIMGGTHVDEHAVYVSEGNLAGSIFSLFIGAFWPAATELYITDPDPLPETYEWFRDATLQAMCTCKTESSCTRRSTRSMARSSRGRSPR